MSDFSYAIALAWFDQEFHEKLLVNPNEALTDLDIDTDANSEIRIVQDTKTLTHAIIPMKPDWVETIEDAMVLLGIDDEHEDSPSSEKSAE